MKEDSGSAGQGWLTCTNMCLCENVLDRVCASARACARACVHACVSNARRHEVVLVPQALAMALVSPT